MSEDLFGERGNETTTSSKRSRTRIRPKHTRLLCGMGGDIESGENVLLGSISHTQHPSYSIMPNGSSGWLLEQNASYHSDSLVPFEIDFDAAWHLKHWSKLTMLDLEEIIAYFPNSNSYLLREKYGKYYLVHGEQEVFYDLGDSQDSVVFFPHFSLLHILTEDTVKVLSH
jgi:hypothetical protein